MESLWTRARGFLSRLDRIQKLALGLSAFGFLTSYLLAFTAGAFFGAGHVAPQGTALRADPQVSAARAAIATAWRSHIDAARRKDLQGVMRIYAKDIAYLIPGEREVQGLSAMEQMERQSLEAADLLHATHTTHGLRVAGDLTYEIGTIEGPLKPAGKPARTVTFHFMALWQRQEDGNWRLRYLAGRPGDRGQ
jgi:uncharacterized protein (TIGR02246 family)